MKTEHTAIEWADYTFNPWRGCTKVSEGCANCYAETLSKRNPALLGEWGKGKPRVLASDAMWASPLKWNRDAALALENWETAVDARAGDAGPKPQRPRVFCASLADWLDAEVPSAWLARLMQTIADTPYLDWLLLTKRPQNWVSQLGAANRYGMNGPLIYNWLVHRTAPANVWLGISAENQARLTERMQWLCAIPAKVKFISAEPLLGPLSFDQPLCPVDCPRCSAGSATSDYAPKGFNGVRWVIAGGESGPQARPMHPDWLRSLRDQCKAADVPFLFKQWGEWLPGCQYQPGDKERLREQAQHSFSLDDHSWRVGKKSAGRQLDGRTHDAFPPSITGLPQR